MISKDTARLMKNCPYCNNPIQSNWYYCRSCNKPLLINLERNIKESIQVHYNEPETYHLDKDKISEDFNDIIIKDAKIDEKIKEIDEILERKEILGDPIPGSLLLEKSSLYYKKRDLSSAMKNLELAIKNFEKEDDSISIAICHNELGIINEDNGFFDQAIYHFNRSLEILEENNEVNKIVKVLNNLGNIYFLIKDLEQSYNHYQKAFTIAQKENMIFDEIKSSSNLVEVLYLLRDYDRIKKILAKNAEFFKNNEDVYGIIQTEIKYGKLYFIIGEDINDASQHLNNALDLISRIRESISVYIKAKLEWECYFYLGKINHLRNNNTKAENLFLRSLEAVRLFEIRDDIKEGEILENLGEIYISKGNIDRAIEYLELSHELYSNFGDKIKNAELKFKIGKIILEFEQNTSKAINYFEEALEIYEDQEYFKESAIILNKIGDIYIQKRMIELALPYFEKARDYFQNIQDKYNSNLINEKIKTLKN
ncbi:MAG: tetratricopeptide repeat protein [Promethearchaeota archaeon]